METLGVIVLAAGAGRRIGGDSPKVLQRTSENSLIGHVLDGVLALSPERCVVVTGFQRALVEDEVSRSFTSAVKSGCLRFAVQETQLGTGHAALSAKTAFEKFVGTILIVCGDAPLLSRESLTRFISLHAERRATVSILSAELTDPGAYGRIVRDPSSHEVIAIREAKDCSAAESLIREVNQGTYAVDSAFLWAALTQIENSNAQGEFYLTDIVGIAVKEGQIVSAMPLHASSEALGVNDFHDLSLVNAVLNARRVAEFQRQGVRVLDPSSVFIDAAVTISTSSGDIARGESAQTHTAVTIGPSVQLRGRTHLSASVTLDGSAVLTDCNVGEGAHIKFGVVASKSQIGAGCSIGPFAHLREGTSLQPEVKIGNFVETKKAVLRRGAKASHLSYLGDCDIGEESNIGAGTITCNYDGYKKSNTTLGKNVFIGSNSALVAPVTIEDGATIGAGSVITQNVPTDALALTRAPQQLKSGWSKRKRELESKKSRPK